TALSLRKIGALERHNVELIGATADAIDKAEDRERFKQAMMSSGLDVPKGFTLKCQLRQKNGSSGNPIYDGNNAPVMELGPETLSKALTVLDEVGLPAVIRPSFTMGGTGDGITIAPTLTLTDKEYQRMRSASIAVLREIGVETGGSNVQWAVNPKDGRMVIIEMNPRVSRSSALASKATGFPIAKIAAKLACGYTLDELKNDITKVTPASFEPTIDYVVTKIPRFAFEKFPGAEPLLTTSMKSVGEAMAIGRTFAESL